MTEGLAAALAVAACWDNPLEVVAAVDVVVVPGRAARATVEEAFVALVAATISVPVEDEETTAALWAVDEVPAWWLVADGGVAIVAAATPLAARRPGTS